MKILYIRNFASKLPSNFKLTLIETSFGSLLGNLLVQELIQEVIQNTFVDEPGFSLAVV